MNDAQHKILLLSINDALNPLCYLIIHTHNQKKKQRFNQFIDNSYTVTKERSCVWCNLKIREKIVSKGVKKGIGMGPYTYLFARLSYSYIVKQQAEWKYATATC